jgi:glycosyltransferase involved in cell wall biosynthesis
MSKSVAPLKVFLDSSPLQSGHAGRGIGTYTRELLAALKDRGDVELVESIADADVLHYPYFDLFQSTLPWRAIKPTVVTIHDVIPLEFPTQYPVGIKGTVALWSQKLALKHVRRIITDSHASRQSIHRFLKLPLAKIDAIYLGADSQFRPISDEATARALTKKYQLPKNFLLYVGDINYNKNIPTLLQSVQYWPESVQLVCVGRAFHKQAIPEWDAIAEALAAAGVQDRVTFLPNVETKNDLASLYSVAAGYIQPSLAEGFGLPILEAMQCETPVISSNRSSLLEVAGQHAILVEPTAHGFTTGVEKLLALSPAKRSKMIKDAAAWAKNFTWQKTAAETVESYRKALEL